jgi:hypothetical protein
LVVVSILSSSSREKAAAAKQLLLIGVKAVVAVFDFGLAGKDKPKVRLGLSSVDMI